MKFGFLLRGIVSKLPALVFYPGDWFRDAAVQSLNTLERGIWFELLLLMHDSPCRGKLLISTQKMYPKAALARRFGIRAKRLDAILDRFVSYGVADRCEETGALMCRRMVRETERNLHIQKVRKDAINTRWKRYKPDTNTDTKPIQNDALSSSSSSSSSKDVPPLKAPPKGGASRALTVSQKRRTRVAENTLLMATIGSWFGRKPTTKWTLQESEALEQVNPSESEIELMAKYYAASMSPKDNIRRRDVGTLLNNWAGELDRAGSFNSGTFFRDNGRANSEVLKELRERLKEAKKDIAGMTQDGRYVPTEEDEWLRLKELRKDRRELKQQIDKIMDAFK